MENRRIGAKYELESQIAQGGMGTIWRALDTQLRRRVAIKMMNAAVADQSDARARFEREAMMVAQLQNQHVVQIFDYGVDQGRPYIVMELLDGEDLQARLSRERHLPPHLVSQLLGAAAKALSPAHAAGIVHRDLKPANLFLARHDTGEVLKVLDFGIADIVSRMGDLGNRGLLVGTPTYMSPEQLRSTDNFDERIDLWALSVIAFRALTGQLPFHAERLVDLIVQITSDVAPLCSALAPALGTTFDAFFARAFARRIGSRFQTARELAAAFAIVAEAGVGTATTPILVVDDEPDVQLLVRQRFRQQIKSKTYEFTFAVDGLDALEKLRARPDIDVVMTDINMPRLGGLAFLAAARELNPIVKVVVVSAYGDMSNIREAMNRGAFDFLTKPIAFQDFELTLQKTIEQARDARKNQRASAENAILRMCVSDSVADRLVPMLKSGAVAGEIQVATVAFIDLHGFSPLVARATPEAALRVLNANLDVILPELAAKKGEIERLDGDQVLALFRGPNHVVRALDACLSVRAQLATLAARAGASSPWAHGVRIGIASGAVVSGGIGSSAAGRFEYGHFGETVSRAARLEAAALRNEILIDEQLRSELGASFQCEPAGARLLGSRLLGAVEPAPVYDVSRNLVATGPLDLSVDITVSASSGYPGVLPETIPALPFKQAK